MPRKNKNAKPRKMSKGIKAPPKHRRHRSNPAQAKALRSAKTLAKRFHGTAVGHVVELDAKERRRPGRYAVVVGELSSLVYDPRGRSKRGGSLWSHESGDRGAGKPKSPNRPLLVVDPKTKQPSIVLNKSTMRFSSRSGLIG